MNKFGFDKNKIKVIPNSEDKFITFPKYINKTFHVQFIDIYEYIVASSLSILKSNHITEDLSKFCETLKYFPSKISRLVWVYSRMNIRTFGVPKLEESNLLVKEKFYLRLIESHVSDEDYNHATIVWEHAS